MTTHKPPDRLIMPGGDHNSSTDYGFYIMALFNNTGRSAAQKLTLSAIILILTGALHTAQAAEGELYLATGMQWLSFDDELALTLPVNSGNVYTLQDDDDHWYFAGIGYSLTDRFSIELSTFDLDVNGTSPTGGARDIDVDHYKLDGLYDLPFSLGRAQPFVLGGVGSLNFDGENSTMWDFGAGLRFNLTNQLSLRAAVRTLHPFDKGFGTDYWGVDASLIFHLGGEGAGPRPRPRPSAPPRRETPPPAPAPAPAPEPEPEPAPVRVEDGPADSDRDGVPDNEDECPATPLAYAVDAVGCPIPVEEVARVELLVNFDFDRTEVKPEYFEEIGEVAEFMEQYPDLMVELEGHTDSVGTDAYNQDLSERRANAVRDVLISEFDVAGGRITAVGHGESQPVATNDTGAGRSENRRVITVIIRRAQDYQPR
ncbi:MAG: OmpA family protein [Pseudohongiellaceae bacterium]